VDFAAAAQRLDAVERLPEHERVTSKLYVMQKLLQLRRDDPELFAQGDYQALQAEGVRKEHVFAFARTHQGRSCIVIVPRWTAKLMDAVSELPLRERVWADTRVTLGNGVQTAKMRDALTGREAAIDAAQGERSLSVAAVLAEFPVAVLYADATETG
jgi:(1->4)-alpha-D-glucan 1-alpha-D-glucosylmutase